VCFGFEVAGSVWDEIEQNKNIRRGARTRGGDWKKKEGWGLLAAPDLAGNICRWEELRRQIPSSSVCPERRDEREGGADVLGVL
jgi:hypothetical protein